MSDDELVEYWDQTGLLQVAQHIKDKIKLSKILNKTTELLIRDIRFNKQNVIKEVHELFIPIMVRLFKYNVTEPKHVYVAFNKWWRSKIKEEIEIRLDNARLYHNLDIQCELMVAFEVYYKENYCLWL